MRIRYEFVRYLVILRFADELRRAKAALCYLTTADYRDCQSRYGLSRGAMKGIVDRLRTWVQGSLVDALKVAIPIVEQHVPIMVDNYVRYVICRLCRRMIIKNLGAIEQHYEHLHFDVMQRYIKIVADELRKRLSAIE